MGGVQDEFVGILRLRQSHGGTFQEKLLHGFENAL
jgi:hypothetical protein